MSVDEYVRTKVPPEHRDTVTMLRALVRELAPGAVERMSYNMPVFESSAHIFAWILASKRDITFSFRAGGSFDDKFDLLRGTGKHARHIKIRSIDSVDGDVLRYYIQQALDLDAT